MEQDGGSPIMSSRLTLKLAVVVCGLLVSSMAHAQGDGAASSSTSSSFRLNNMRDPRNFSGDRPANSDRPTSYSRSNPSTMPPPARSQAATFSRVRDYFPAARSGRSINRNVVDPRTLCVPGRRAMLQR